MNIWTIQLAKWRTARERQIPLIDITAMSGIPEFAPHFTDVQRYKRGEVGETEYTQLYVDKMEESKATNPQAWVKLSTMPDVAFACYCRAGAFCHRHIFKTILMEYLKEKGIDSTYKGELAKEVLPETNDVAPRQVTFEVGDIVRPTETGKLADGNIVYSAAIVVSLKPFVLVSGNTEARWEDSVDPLFLFKTGKTNPDHLQKCMTRLKK